MQFHSPKYLAPFQFVSMTTEEGKPCRECLKLKTEISHLKGILERIGLPLPSGPQEYPAMNKGSSPMPKARATVWESAWANAPDDISPIRHHTNYLLKPGHEVDPSVQNLYKEIGRLSRELDIANGVIQAYRCKEPSANLKTHADTESNTDVFMSKKIDLSQIDKDWMDRQKIGELYNSIFTEEWGHVLKILNDSGISHKDSFKILLDTLLETYDSCRTLSAQQLQRIIDATKLSIETGNKKIWNVSNTDVVHYRKRIAQSTAASLKQNYSTSSVKCLAELPQKTRDSRRVQDYVGRCIEVTWYMCVMEPPMAFYHNVKKGSNFDTSKFNFYKIEGQKMGHVIWPQLLSSANGLTVAKGWANAEDIYGMKGSHISIGGLASAKNVANQPGSHLGTTDTKGSLFETKVKVNTSILLEKEQDDLQSPLP